MNCNQKGVLLWLAMAWIVTPACNAAKTTQDHPRPEVLVRSLYHEVELRAPSGLLSDTDQRTFMPLVSRALRRKMDLAAACEKDWIRQNPAQDVKAPFGWSEFGLFSGANERTSPGNFHISTIRKENDGSFYLVVTFKYRPTDGTGSWHVTDHVIRENGRFVLDDVIFPKEGPEARFTLSGRLEEGCSGSHWVGLR